MIARPPEPAADRAAAASLRLGRCLGPEDLSRLMERVGGGALTLLESAGPPGRWSLLASHPTARFVSCAGENHFHWHSRGVIHAWREAPLAALRRVLAAFPRVESDPALPIHGGALGLFAYELGRRLLPIRPQAADDLGLPDIALFFHERLLAVDRTSGEAYALATARGASAASARGEARARATLFAEDLLALLDAPASAAAASPAADPPPGAAPATAALDGAGEPGSRASLEREGYLAAVAHCREAILDGEAYELCLTTRFAVPFTGDPLALYGRLRGTNPAPYASFFRHPEGLLVGASPERFLRVSAAGHVEARPIKGTRPRGRIAAEDAAFHAELAASAKDRAENVMIVDLLRNDLHRVCTPGSVAVSELCAIEAHPAVFQMVSTIEGELAPGQDRCDLLASAFPGGSMTGAPKIAAMQILEGLEPCVRGWYSGCQGYLGFDGSLDLSIVIRGIQLLRGQALVGAGGAVVYDSDPEAEWEEARHKARASLAALRGT
jgi:para-aminobenzoate synthetase component 1